MERNSDRIRKYGTLCQWTEKKIGYLLIYYYSGVIRFTRLYPKASGLAAWSENKWYSSLPLGVIVSLFCESF
jgi:hypothetical protein